MTNFSKPGNCECGAGVDFYGKKNRGWLCGRRDKWDGIAWVKWTACPIPDALIADRGEVARLKKENISLRNTISALTEENATLEEDKRHLGNAVQTLKNSYDSLEEKYLTGRGNG